MPFELRATLSIPSSESIAQAIDAHYDLGPIASVDLYRSYANEVYRLVAATGDVFFAKLARRGWRDEANVRWNSLLLEHLVTHGVPASRPVRTRLGELDIAVTAPEGDRGLMVVPCAPGRKPHPPHSEDLYAAVGAATARMHTALDTFDAPCPRPARTAEWLIDRSLQIVIDDIGAGDARTAGISRLATTIRRELDAIPGLDLGVIHGDASLDNLTVDADGTIAFFDVDLGAPGYRAEEPHGIYAWHIAEPSVTPLWRAWLSGYRGARPFPEAHERAVLLLAAANRLWNLAHDLEYWAKWSGRWVVTPERVAAQLTTFLEWEPRIQR